MATTKEQQRIVEKFCEGFRKSPRFPVKKWQRAFPQDAPVKGPVWIAKTSFPGSAESGIRDAVYDAFEGLKTGVQEIPPREDVRLADVRVEWIGRREGQAGAKDAGMTERQKYDALKEECSSDTVIFYLHGGALYLGSAVASRAASTRLAIESKARVASVSYRLAPQEPFPAALIDVFVAYMSLLYPQADSSWHDKIAPNRIVLAGDSAGGNLCMSLVQLILQLQRSGQDHILFHGTEVPIPLPAGMAFLSPWGDLTDSFPSFDQNTALDFLPYPQPPLTPSFPSDTVWPSSPPRGHMYCDASALDHPLVSPSAARTWRGAPPLYMALGAEERGIDGAGMVAAVAGAQGVCVRWEVYEGMTHAFALMLGRLPQAVECTRRWADACVEFAGGRAGASCSTLVKMPDCRRVVMEARRVGEGEREEAWRRMRENAATKFPVWYGTEAKAKM